MLIEIFQLLLEVISKQLSGGSARNQENSDVVSELRFDPEVMWMEGRTASVWDLILVNTVCGVMHPLSQLLITLCVIKCRRDFTVYLLYTVAYWRGGVLKPPPRNSEGPPKSCQIQPDLWKLLKIAEFRTPTLQDVRKKGSTILKLPKFTIVLH